MHPDYLQIFYKLSTTTSNIGSYNNRNDSHYHFLKQVKKFHDENFQEVLVIPSLFFHFMTIRFKCICVQFYNNILKGALYGI